MVSSIVIGNASIDVIEGFQDQPGGAVTYVSNVLIKLDHRVRAISSFGNDYPKEYIPARKGEYPFTLADYTKANQELGWTPTLDIKDYIKTKVK